MPKVACDRAETKPKVKKTASLSNFSAALQHLWNCSNTTTSETRELFSKVSANQKPNGKADDNK
jgi:hypothetical protein